MLRYGQRYWQLKDILSRLLAEKIRRHKQLQTAVPLFENGILCYINHALYLALREFLVGT